MLVCYACLIGFFLFLFVSFFIPQFVTLYAFSTENWSRPSAEVSFLMEVRTTLRTIHAVLDGGAVGGRRVEGVGGAGVLEEGRGGGGRRGGCQGEKS